ncbi:MAG: DUF2807 domain-containing protein [Tannerella sp.]|jgi:hypothetical protein|nr:DUF2807 domain-containing protein [Tannerella sp.]
MSSKKIIWIAAIVVIFASCVSCTFFLPIKGNGNLVTSEKTVPAFEKISVSSSAEVRFHASQEYRAVVTVDENLDEYVEIVSKNNALNIGTKSGSYSFTKFSVDIYCPILSGVSVSGSGSFKNMDEITVSTFETSVSGSGKIEGTVKCEKFSARISGSGKINVGGNSKDADIGISGSGRYNGNDFIVNNATVRISGSGNADVHVTENLKANISGSGGINYRGEPKTDTKVSGSGRIRKL